MNFFQAARGEGKRDMPRRVYASFDSVEWIGAQHKEIGRFAFDAVDADWFDSDRVGFNPGLSGALDPFVSIAAFDLTYGASGFINGILRGAADEDQADFRPWIEIRFDRGEYTISHFLNLTGPPAARKAEILPVDNATIAALEQLVSLQDIQSATKEDLEAALTIDPARAASVYDVGQGNCNAILNDAYQPLLYYDFGGGVLWHAATVPPGLKGMCVCTQPPVVLSHWDWDHWAIAAHGHTHAASGNPLALPWIAPCQRIGAVHRAFIAKLTNLLLWPDHGLPKLDVGQITVHKCDSPRSNRNNSGLVIEFRPHWASGNGVLLPGDCDYDFLPAEIAQRQDYEVICVPHHGGKLPSNNVFAPAPGAAYRRLCYSAGDPNHYGHPRPDTVNAHLTNRWTSGEERYTYKPRKSGTHPFGHILLDNDWQVQPRAAKAPCACEVPYWQYLHYLHNPRRRFMELQQRRRNPRFP